MSSSLQTFRVVLRKKALTHCAASSRALRQYATATEQSESAETTFTGTPSWVKPLARAEKLKVKAEKLAEIRTAMDHQDPKEWLLPIPPPRESKLKRIPIYPAPPSAAKVCREPLKAVTESQIDVLDPSGARSRLFSRDSPESVQVGDIILVRQREGDPFSGVVMSIRRRGADSAVLLRAGLTRVGVEMWFKIYSPNVTGIEIVQRSRKRMRRARLYYLRKPKHDVGSVESVVRQYLKQRAVLGTAVNRSRSKSTGSEQKNAKQGKK